MKLFSKINRYNFMVGFLMSLFVAFLIWNQGNTWFDKEFFPLSGFVKEYYITHSATETLAGNSVTGIYLDYRLFDTLFETMLLFVSVIAVYYFSRHQGEQQ